MADKDEWEFYYWCLMKEDGRNYMIGRGEFVRLMFEACGVGYKEMGAITPHKQGESADSQPENEVAKFVFMGGNTGYPAFAPPVIKKGDFVLAQTPTICKFLGKKYGMYPDNDEDEAHADQVMMTVTDFIAEGRNAYHPVENSKSYFDQVEEAKPYIAKFANERMPRFLKHLEACLKANTEGNSEYVVGKKATYVDMGLFHVLCAAESQFPDEYKAQIPDHPLLAQHKDRIAALPRIAEYLASDRRGFFEGNSMM
mmetsp:Transcript_1693/g.2738  ORF Transcript_1693/g.2738 Transcript_1693/m.2738 type:complete len:255 (-) Transcript_1693:294-1058(-)